MEGEIFVVTLVAICCATGLIKAWINRNKQDNTVDEESFNRLARAFMQHKKEMQERLKKLETSNTNQVRSNSNFSQIEDSGKDGSLKNDLKQSEKARTRN